MSCPEAATRRETLIEALSEYSLQLMWMMRQDAMHTFEPLGLRPVRALLLELIGRGCKHPKSLSDVLDTVPPAISAMIAECEQQGLLLRTIDPEDKRRVRLELSPEGETLRQELKQLWRQAGVRRLERLSEDELERLITIYRKLLENA